MFSASRQWNTNSTRLDALFSMVLGTPDGRGIIVSKLQSDGNSELWLVSTVGEPPLQLEIDANRVASGSWSRMDLHPDGERLAFHLGEIKVDVWVLENFQSSKRWTK